MFLVWVISGMINTQLAFGVIGVSLVLLKTKNMYKEIFIGFIFILILSDRLEPQLLFAKSVKNLYMVMMITFFIFDRKQFRPINNLFLIFLPFFLWSFFCLTEAAVFSTGLQKTVSYVFLFIIGPNYVMKIFRSDGDQFFRDFIFFIASIFLIGIALILINPSMAFIGGRYNGPLGNPNGLGLFTFLFFVLYNVIDHLRGSVFSRNEHIFLIAVIIITLILCGSRNSIIAVLLFLLLKRFYTISPFLGFIILIVVIILAELLSTNINLIITSLGLEKFFRLETLKEGSGRFIAWDFAWRHIQENFFVGRGFSYNEFYMRQHYRILTKLGHQGGIHNSFLTFWMDTGLIGLLLYLGSFISAFYQASKRSAYAFPIMFAVMFSAFFESWLVGSLNPHTILFLFSLGLISEISVNKKFEQRLAVNEDPGK